MHIKKIPEIVQESFIEKGDEILVLKRADPAEDTNTIKVEIDPLVYDFHELTKEEIRIIELDI